jgi:hypothetical protein
MRLWRTPSFADGSVRERLFRGSAAFFNESIIRPIITGRYLKYLLAAWRRERKSNTGLTRRYRLAWLERHNENERTQDKPADLQAWKELNRVLGLDAMKVIGCDREKEPETVALTRANIKVATTTKWEVKMTRKYSIASSVMVAKIVEIPIPLFFDFATKKVTNMNAIKSVTSIVIKANIIRLRSIYVPYKRETPFVAISRALCLANTHKRYESKGICGRGWAAPVKWCETECALGENSTSD